jgi:hypothetical protein
MFAGHLGAALDMSGAERRINVGFFVLAALLLDIVLWIFVLLGWESLTIPADFATQHQVRFHFPYTHSLLAAIGWSILACLVGAALARGRGHTGSLMPALLAATVFSHWLLDALVHEPELPLAGENSAQRLVAVCALACWLGKAHRTDSPASVEL